MQRAMPARSRSAVRGGDGGDALAIDAHHLVRIAVLGPAQQPLFDGRGAVVDREHQAAVDFQVVEQLADGAAFFVIAHDGGQDRLRAQRRQHRGHAAGPAQAVLLALDPQDGNGGFRADPLHVAPDVAIQHHVAHQQHARAKVPFQQSRR